MLIMTMFAARACGKSEVKGENRMSTMRIRNARVFNSVMMGGLAQLVGGDADVWRSVIADRVAPKVRDLNVRAFDAGLNHTF